MSGIMNRFLPFVFCIFCSVNWGSPYSGAGVRQARSESLQRLVSQRLESTSMITDWFGILTYSDQALVYIWPFSIVLKVFDRKPSLFFFLIYTFWWIKVTSKVLWIEIPNGHRRHHRSSHTWQRFVEGSMDGTVQLWHDDGTLRWGPHRNWWSWCNI